MHLHLCACYRSCSPCQSLVDYGNIKTPSMHHRLGSTTVTVGFPQGKQPKFSMREIPVGQCSYKISKMKLINNFRTHHSWFFSCAQQRSRSKRSQRPPHWSEHRGFYPWMHQHSHPVSKLAWETKCRQLLPVAPHLALGQAPRKVQVGTGRLWCDPLSQLFFTFADILGR